MNHCDVSIFIPPVENKTNEEFVKVCPAKIVPAIDDNGFKLFERCVASVINFCSSEGEYLVY